MNITSKATFLFHRPNPKTGTRDEVQVHPTAAGVVVNVPEWVRDTLLYRLAAKDGNVQEVAFVPAPPAPEGGNRKPDEAMGSGLQGGSDKPNVVATEKDLAFLRSRGYRPTTVEDAQRFIDNLSPGHLRGYLRECEEFDPAAQAWDNAPASAPEGVKPEGQKTAAEENASDGVATEEQPESKPEPTGKGKGKSK